jgi:hypothetical protein
MPMTSAAAMISSAMLMISSAMLRAGTTTVHCLLRPHRRIVGHLLSLEFFPIKSAAPLRGDSTGIDSEVLFAASNPDTISRAPMMPAVSSSSSASDE